MALIKHDERYGPYMTANNAPAPYAATASQNSWGAFRAFSESLDDDISFTGLAAGAEQWVQIKLDAPIRIWAFRVACRTTVSAKDAGQVPKNFKVQGSVDGNVFEDIQNYIDVDWSQFASWDAAINKYDWSDSKKIEITCTKEYQYYRFLFGECQAISTQKLGSMTPTSSNTVKVTLIDMYQVEGEESPEITVTGIRITHLPDKTRYEIGAELDATGLEVMADMSDGTAQAVTDYTLSGYDSATTGQKTVTVTYQGRMATFVVSVYELSSIAITTPPDKVQYNVGETLDLSGMVVTATYSDGITEVVTDYTVSGYDSSVAGTCTVVVAYQGETVSFEATVVAASHILRQYIGSPNLEDVVAELDTETWVMTISGTGAIKDFSDSDVLDMSGGMPSIHPPFFKDQHKSIRKIIVENGVTHIGRYTIYGYASDKLFEDVAMSGAIPPDAKFEQYCAALEEIHVAESVVSATSKTAIGMTVVRESINTGGIANLYGPDRTWVMTGTWCPVIYTKADATQLDGLRSQDVKGLIVVKDALVEASGYGYIDNGEYVTVTGKCGVALPGDTSATIDVSQSINNKPVKCIDGHTSFPLSTGSIINVSSSVDTITEYSFASKASDITINIDSPENRITGSPWGAEGATVNWTGVAKQLAGITISSLPSKTQYLIGDTLDQTGLVVNASYDDGTTEAVTDYTLSGFDSTTAGTKTITVTYQGFTASFEVKVAIPGVALESLLNTTAGMTAIRNNVKNDDGTDTVTGVDWFTYAGKVCSSIYVSGNNWIGFGTSSEQLEICRRDGAVYYVYRQEGELDGGTKFLKLRVEGYTYYSSTTDDYKLIYEVFLFDDGCLFINAIQSPTNSSYIGTSSITDGSNTATLNIPTGITSAAPVEITVGHAGNAQVITYERYVPSFIAVSIEITAPCEKTAYYGNELFDSTGMVVSLVDADGNKKAVTDYVLSGYDSSMPGTKTITATKNTFTAAFEVVISEIAITGIIATKLPDKVEYIPGEVLDITGLEVSFALSDGTKVAADRYTVVSLDSATSGAKQISITYGNIEGAFEVVVLAPQSIEITHLPNRTSYIKGETLDLTGMIVSEVYSNGRKKEVTGYEASAFDSTQYGSKTITITREGLEATFTVEVSRYASVQIGSPNLEDVTAVLDSATWILTIAGTGAIKDFSQEDIMDTSGGMPTVHPPIFKEHFRRVKEIVVEEGITKIGAYFLVGYASESFLITIMKLMEGMTVSDKVGTCFSDLQKIKLSKSVVQLSEYSIAYNCARQEIDLGGVQNNNSIYGSSGFAGNLSPLIRTNLSVETIWNVRGTNFGLMLPVDAIYDETSGFAYLENSSGLTVIGKRGILFPADTPLIINIPESYKDMPITMIDDVVGFPMSDGTVINVPHSVKSISEVSFINNFASGLTINIDAKEGDIPGAPWEAPENTVINWLDNAQVTGIVIAALPSKIKYIVGDTLDQTGLIVIARYDDGTDKEVTGYTLSGFDSDTEGRKTILVSFKGMTAEFQVTVLPAPSETMQYIGSPNLPDITAEYDLDTHVLTISGSGDMKDFNSVGGSSYPFSELMYEHRLDINKIIVESGVTSLGRYCFAGMENVTEISLCEGMIRIGSYAFAGHKVQRIEIPETVLQFETSWFIECSNLSYVKLGGENAGEIPTGLLANTSVLKEIYVVGCAKFGKNELGGASSTVESIIIGEYVRAVENFSHCTSLKKIEVLAPITEVPTSFANSCSALTSVILPQSVTKMGYTAFGWCTSLESFSLPRELTELGNACFMGCTKLKNINFPPKLTRIPSVCFDGCGFTDIRIDDNCAVKTIDGSFMNNGDLKNVYIGSCVKEITGGTFAGSGPLTITVNNKEDAIAGAPWSAPSGSTVVWLIPITSINVSSLPNKTGYEFGEEFDGTGLVVSATYSDGSSELITGYTLSGFDSTQPGMKLITVTYKEHTTTFEVGVYGAVTGIRIAQYPNKVYYKLGETLDATGLQVVATTEGGADRPITDYTLSDLDSSTVGNKWIIVTYETPVADDTTAVYTAYFAVKVTATGDNPFEDTTELITVTVHWPNGEFADLTNTDLAGGTGVMTLQESICSDNYFIFGGCISNMLKFTTHSAQFLSTDEAAYPHGDIEVYIKCKGTRIKIFTGTIDSGKRKAGLTQRDIIAYDKLYQFRNTDIAWWYKNKTTDKQMLLTQKQFREELFGYLGIEQVPTKLYYDDAFVPNTNVSAELNAVRIIKDMCLQNNVFGWINRDGKFEYLKLPENSREKSHDNAGNVTYEYFPATVYADNYEACDFTEGRIWYPTEFYSDPNPQYGFSSGPPNAQEAYERNVYYNRNSFFIGNYDWLDYAWKVDEYGIATVQDPAFPICYGPFADIFRLYRVQGYSVTVRGNPLNKVGDTIEITVRKTADDGTQLEWVIHSYIMSRTLKLLGDTSMYDTYSARNAPYNGNNTQAGTYIPELSAEMFRARAEGPVISYADFDDGTTPADGLKKARLKCVKSLTEAEYTALQASSVGLRTDTLYFVKE